MKLFIVIYIINPKIYFNNKYLKKEGEKESRTSKGVKLNKCHQTSPYNLFGFCGSIINREILGAKILIPGSLKFASGIRITH